MENKKNNTIGAKLAEAIRKKKEEEDNCHFFKVVEDEKNKENSYFSGGK